MNASLKLLIAAILGAGVWAVIAPFLPNENAKSAQEKIANQPLYWVAPMDSNYRRDAPGVSPMGMDLVPVYEDDNNNQNEVGAVTISPAVVNNLGVRTAQVQLKKLHSNINTLGYVQYNQDEVYHIHPRVEGWLESLFIKTQGDKVIAGEPLYTLYSPQLVNAQEEFLLALKRNNSVLIAAAKARLASLNVSDGFVERLQKNKQIKQSITFYAPKSGVVDELNVQEGFYVKPGTSMMSIAQLDEVWVEAQIFERQSALIHVGMPVSMTLDYLRGRVWQGKVDYIYPALNDKNRTLRVRLRFDNKDYKLKPNMFAQVSIHAQASEAQFTVPKEAIIRTQYQNRVVISLGEGRFKSVEVKIGQMNDDEAVILSGVMADDRVVTSAQFLIDSESSKRSDFKRMQTPNDQLGADSCMNMGAQSTTLNGVVNTIDEQNRVINISREAIGKWNRYPATIDYLLAPELSPHSFKKGQVINFTFSTMDDVYVLCALKNTEPMDHSTMHHMSGEETR